MCEFSSKSAERCGNKMLWQTYTHTHIQTHRHTDTQTGLVLDVNIFSYEMTEYKTRTLRCYKHIQSFLILFGRFFRYFPLFLKDVINWRWKYDHILYQRLKINTKQYFVFRFLQIFKLTVIFAILIGHIELKILPEIASLQSHT